MKTLLVSFLSFLSLAFVVDSRADYEEHEDILVHSHSVKNTHIHQLPRYCLHPMTEGKSLHMDRITPDLKFWIANRIKDLLTSKGFVESPNYQCDLEIAYEIKVKNQALLHDPRLRHINSSGVIAERIELIPERTLIIYAHDLHFDRTLWVGMAEEIVFNMKQGSQSIEAIESRLNYAFTKLSKTFPAYGG